LSECLLEDTNVSLADKTEVFDSTRSLFSGSEMCSVITCGIRAASPQEATISFELIRGSDLRSAALSYSRWDNCLTSFQTISIRDRRSTNGACCSVFKRKDVLISRTSVVSEEVVSVIALYLVGGIVLLSQAYRPSRVSSCCDRFEFV